MSTEMQHIVFKNCFANFPTADGGFNAQSLMFAYITMFKDKK